MGHLLAFASMTLRRPTSYESDALVKRLKNGVSDAKALEALKAYAQQARARAGVSEPQPGPLGLKDANGRSLLHLVAMAERAELVQAALELGGRIDERDEFGETPLTTACASPEFGAKSSACALALLKAGASASATSLLGLGPIHVAAEAGMLAVCELLVKKGVGVNEEGGVFKDTPFLMAVQAIADQGCPLNEKNEAFLSGLLRLGADISRASSSMNRDALGWAVYALGHHSLIRYLVKNGCPVNRQDAKGRTPLRVACQLDPGPNLEASAAALLELGADPWIADAFGYGCVNRHHSSSDNPRMKALIKSWLEAREIGSSIESSASAVPKRPSSL